MIFGSVLWSWLGMNSRILWLWLLFCIRTWHMSHLVQMWLQLFIQDVSHPFELSKTCLKVCKYIKFLEADNISVPVHPVNYSVSWFFKISSAVFFPPPCSPLLFFHLHEAHLGRRLAEHLNQLWPMTNQVHKRRAVARRRWQISHVMVCTSTRVASCAFSSTHFLPCERLGAYLTNFLYFQCLLEAHSLTSTCCSSSRLQHCGSCLWLDRLFTLGFI